MNFFLVLSKGKVSWWAKLPCANEGSPKLTEPQATASAPTLQHSVGLSLRSASCCPNQIAHLIINVPAMESLSPWRLTSDLPDTLTTLRSLFLPQDLSFCFKNVWIKDAFVPTSPACDIVTQCLMAEWNSFTVWVLLSAEGQDLGFRRKWIG